MRRDGQDQQPRAEIADQIAGRDADELAAQLVPALALLGQALGRDLAEPDWWRVMDALLLVAAHPG